MSTVLLTGASGFIGKHLVQALVAANYRVLVYTHKQPLTKLGFSSQVIAYNINVGLEKPFQEYQIDAVLHLAATYDKPDISISQIIDTNLLLPLRLLALTEKYAVKAFINTCSFFCKPEYDLGYQKRYVLSKRQLLEWAASKAFKTKFITLRLEHVYGPGDSRHKFVSMVMEHLRSRKLMALTEASQLRDFVYVADVVQAYLCVLSHLDDVETNQIYEVGTGRCASVKEFVTLLAQELAGVDLMGFGQIPLRAGEIEASSANNEALRALGWQPKYNRLDGIRAMLERDLGSHD